MSVVINLFAGPGSGKSTTAAGLFFYMKLRGFKVELVTEYAKELAYTGQTPINQQEILEEQYRRQSILKGQVDFIITDSPLLLSEVYGHSEQEAKAARACFNRFNNINFFIERVKPYAQYGRTQDEQEAKALDLRIKDMMDNNRLKYTSIRGDNEAPGKILKTLYEERL